MISICTLSSSGRIVCCKLALYQQCRLFLRCTTNVSDDLHKNLGYSRSIQHWRVKTQQTQEPCGVSVCVSHTDMKHIQGVEVTGLFTCCQHGSHSITHDASVWLSCMLSMCYIHREIFKNILTCIKPVWVKLIDSIDNKSDWFTLTDKSSTRTPSYFLCFCSIWCLCSLTSLAFICFSLPILISFPLHSFSLPVLPLAPVPRAPLCLLLLSSLAIFYSSVFLTLTPDTGI